MAFAEEETTCPICGRRVPLAECTRHHLVPRSRGGKEQIPLCHACHKQVHALFTEKELARNYPTVEALRAHPEVAKWIAWVRRRKVTT